MSLLEYGFSVEWIGERALPYRGSNFLMQIAEWGEVVVGKFVWVGFCWRSLAVSQDLFGIRFS